MMQIIHGEARGSQNPKSIPMRVPIIGAQTKKQQMEKDQAAVAELQGLVLLARELFPNVVQRLWGDSCMVKEPDIVGQVASGEAYALAREFRKHTKRVAKQELAEGADDGEDDNGAAKEHQGDADGAA